MPDIKMSKPNLQVVNLGLLKFVIDLYLYIEFHTPGPCNYYIPDSMNDSGIYTESKHRGQGKRIICKELRKSFIDTILDKLK